MVTEIERAIMPFASAEAWEAWLAEHHATSSGLWLKLAKKDTGIDSVTYAEAVDVALRYGWIDGQKDRFDELDGNEVAREFFATLDRTNRYAILYRIQDAKKPETRARRIEQFVAMLSEHKKPYP